MDDDNSDNKEKQLKMLEHCTMIRNTQHENVQMQDYKCREV